MEDEQGNETEVQPEVTPGETQQGDNQTPTVDVESLQKQINELTAKYDEKDKGFKSLQALVNEKDQKLKEASNFQGELEALKETQKIFAAMLSEKEGISDLDEMPSGKKTDYLKKFEEIESNQKQKKQLEQLQEQIGAIQNRVNTLGLTEADDAYWEIYELATTGTPASLKRAEIKLNKMEANKVETQKENPKESDEIKELRAKNAELEKQLKISSGELDVDKAQPSGGGFKTYTKEQVANMTSKQYEKERDNILAAIREGNVK